MTNFELVTQNIRTMDDFISAVVDDALQAEGCSLDLKLPSDLREHTPDAPYLSWEEWLAQTCEDEMLCFPGGVRIENIHLRAADPCATIPAYPTGDDDHAQ